MITRVILHTIYKELKKKSELSSSKVASFTIQVVSIFSDDQPPGEYSEFKVTGMWKGFFGFEIFNSRIFLGKNILASIFWGGLSEVGILFLYIQNNMKIRGKELLQCVVPA